MSRLASLLLSNQDTVPISTNNTSDRPRNAPYPDVSVQGKRVENKLQVYMEPTHQPTQGRPPRFQLGSESSVNHEGFFYDELITNL